LLLSKTSVGLLRKKNHPTVGTNASRGQVIKKTVTVLVLSMHNLFIPAFLSYSSGIVFIKEKETFPLELRSSNSWFLFYPLIKKKNMWKSIFLREKGKNFFLLPFFGFFPLTHHHLRKKVS
jgi:hypothetical protein